MRRLPLCVAPQLIVLPQSVLFANCNYDLRKNLQNRFRASTPYLSVTDAIMAQLVREYLEFTGLEYSCSVFNAETENAGKASPQRYGGRSGLSQQLGLGQRGTNEKRPLLHTILTLFSGLVATIPGGQNATEMFASSVIQTFRLSMLSDPTNIPFFVSFHSSKTLVMASPQ